MFVSVTSKYNSFVVDKVLLGEVFLRVLPLQLHIYSCLIWGLDSGSRQQPQFHRDMVLCRSKRNMFPANGCIRFKKRIQAPSSKKPSETRCRLFRLNNAVSSSHKVSPTFFQILLCNFQTFMALQRERGTLYGRSTFLNVIYYSYFFYFLLFFFLFLLLIILLFVFVFYSYYFQCYYCWILITIVMLMNINNKLIELN